VSDACLQKTGTRGIMGASYIELCRHGPPKIYMFPWIVRLFAISMSSFLLLGSVQQSPSAGQKERIRRLQMAVLAPCCYSEPVFRHNSDISMKMRAEIAEWVVAGRSDREILDTYKQQYGLMVLAEPEGAKWWWEHVIPLIVLALGTLVVVFVLRHMLRTRRPAVAVAGDLPPLPDEFDD
jgi:cytochrome c-type biogenesis protein CcmH/NrfF